MQQVRESRLSLSLWAGGKGQSLAARHAASESLLGRDALHWRRCGDGDIARGWGGRLSVPVSGGGVGGDGDGMGIG